LRPSGSGRPPRTTTGDLSRIGGARRRRDPASGAPYLVPGGLALLAAIAAWLLWGRIASCAPAIAGADAQIRAALANQGRAHLDDVYGFRAGGTVELAPVRFAEVVPSVDGDRATVVAMVDAEGRVAWRGEAARLSYLGRERFHLRPCSIALWCGEGDQFDRLRGVLLALFRRHDAVLARDAAALARLAGSAYADRGEDRGAVAARAARELAGPAEAVRIVAWQVRVDRDVAEVGEDAEVTPAGGAARSERRVYRLAREPERWVFTSGL
jgi:hypothetical protein